MYAYGSIYHAGAYYIFGGYNNADNIARLDEVSQQWSRAGRMINRARHNVVFDGEAFLVVGGSASMKNVKCLLEGTVMVCNEQESEPLTKYSEPALFLTADNYGENC